jgi:citrate synthase
MEVAAMAAWITSEAAAERLGVKRATLYAYVSRGVLVRRRAAGGRGSLFDSGEIERLARRGRPRGAPGGAELVIESALTEISADRLRYRGYEVTSLAVTRSFEEVAGLLWTADLGPAAEPPAAPRQAGPGLPGSARSAPAGQWRATPEAVAVGAAAQSALPAGALPLERLQVIVPALAAADPLRLHLDPPAVAAAGRAMISGMIDCLPGPPLARPATGQQPRSPAPGGARRPAPGVPAGQAAPATAAIALRLWRKICPNEPTEGLLTALRAALVLLADHELAASTLAVRVAASVRADPYAAVATGLGALGGPLHGGASLGAEDMLAAAAAAEDAPRVVGDLLRRTGRVPGFGHFVYRTGDPRASCLLDLVERGARGSERLAVSDAVLAEMRRRALPEPNIDFALAALADVAGMISGAGEAVFAVARTAGWIAHALEEYAREVPLRPRAVYTGPPARDAPG